MKKYPEYKDSGVEWIGKIPSHWENKKLKYSIKIRSGEGISNNLIFSDGKFPIYGGNGIMGFCDLTNSNDVEIIIGRVGALCGNIYFVNGEKWVSDNALRVETKENYKFISYLLIAMNLNDLASKTAQPLLTSTLIKNQYIATPLDQNEQTTIANFLDHKTQLIDDLIAKKERLIELLKEERIAVINQAVTKGLDPNVPMKDSGIKWLGEIPEHWEVKRLKYCADILFSNVDKKVNEVDSKVMLCNYTDVYNNDFITLEINFMIATAKGAEIERFTLKKGDVIITKDSESPDDIAVPAYVNEIIEGLLCGYHLAIIRGGAQMHSLFLFYLFKSYKFNQQFTVSARGITRFGIGQQSVNNSAIPIPSIPEQERIAQFVFEMTSSIDKSVEQIHIEISLFKEYKTSLINEAVTGKIDVRDYKN